MANSADLIGQLLGGVLNPNSGQRLDRALGPSGLGAADNPLAKIFGQLSGGQGGAAAGGLAEMATRFGQTLQQNKAAAGGVGALAGLLLGGTRGAAVKGGALALLGSLAMSALAKSGRLQAPASAQELPPSLKPVQTDLDAADVDARADLLLNAMVQAAKSDGHIDDAEMQKIQGKLTEGGVDAAELKRLMALMQAPVDMDALVVKINDVETAAEVYAASLLAVNVDTDQERRYLAELAQRTGLDAATVRHIHDMLGIAA